MTEGGTRTAIAGSTRALAERAGRHRRALTWAALAVLMLAAAAFLLHLTRGTTLYRDEWFWAQQRRGNNLGTFLEPHFGHLSIVPLALYRVLFATAGLDHTWPYRVLVTAGHLTCVLLLFVYARRRVGDFLGLLIAALLLFLGPAAQNILWPFQIGWLVSLGAGIAALLCLDRRDRAGAFGACALLAVSLASSGLGQAIAVGVAVEVLWRRRREAWIVAVPIALYALWWLVYQTDQTGGWGEDLLLLPGWVASAPAVALSSLAGLAGPTTIDGPLTPLTWGIPLLVAALLALCWRLGRIWPVPARAVALATTALSFWAVTALARAFFGGPVAGRYIYVGAIFVLLLTAELARGVSVRPATAALLAVLVAGAALSNLEAFRVAGRDLRDRARLARAEVGALEIARPLVPPDYVSRGFMFKEVVAGPYFAAVDALGSPAAGPAEIAVQPEDVRKAADAQLVAVHRVALSAPGGSAASGPLPPVVAARAVAVRGRAGCLRVRPAAVAPPGAVSELQVALPPGGARVAADGGPVAVGVRRFADEARPVATVASGSAAVLRIGPDRAPQPWILRVAPTAAATVCGRA